jgi:hypothetical protein
VYWARYREGSRVEGPAVNAMADVAVGSSQLHTAYPTPIGLVRAVSDWTTAPAPLVPLYLRRPDAKTLAERQAASR